MTIRNIEPLDNESIAAIIRQVMTEFGASGEGYSIHDREVDLMFEAYNLPRSAFFVVEEEGRVVGGAGIAPLAGEDEDICELKKMYFLPEARGKGMGKEIIKRCLHSARAFGYKTCYIETVVRMELPTSCINHLDLGKLMLQWAIQGIVHARFFMNFRLFN